MTQDTETTASLRLRLAPGDARYAGGLVPGSKTMELFADLETEIALREGGDEGLCVAYDMVKVLEVDEHGRNVPLAEPVLAARASVTIVVGQTPA